MPRLQNNAMPSQPSSISPHPRLSVIVPVFDHWHLVPALLACLQRQTLSQSRFEVLLVDNGSTCFAPPDTLPDNTRLLHCATPGSYAARNLAVQQARGEWLVFTDADCLPVAGWLEVLMGKAERLEGQPAILAGAIQMRAEAVPNRYEQYDLVKGIPQAWYVSRGYAVTANLALPAELLHRLGGFDARRYSGGDAELARRAKTAGASLYYVAEAEVAHPARRTWQALATKARRIKGGQLTAGTPRQRALWLIRTFTPPLLAWYRFLLRSRQPLGYRLTACVLQAGLWGVEAHETIRLLCAGKAERR